jgi:uncharacterized protein (DUF2267 family)
VTTQEFLAAVQRAGGPTTRKDAEQWIGAVLRALVQLAPDTETRRQFITQLPGPLKAPLLAEPAHPLLMNREAFIGHVGAALDIHAPEAERAVHAVYSALRLAISGNELAEFEARVPRDVAALLARTA